MSVNDVVETGETTCSDDEAQAVLTIMFAPGVGDAVRALRAYCDKRIAEVLLLLTPDATQPAESDT